MHYNGHGVPKPTTNGEVLIVYANGCILIIAVSKTTFLLQYSDVYISIYISIFLHIRASIYLCIQVWVFNKSYTQYIPLSLYDLQAWVGGPSMLVRTFMCTGRQTCMYPLYIDLSNKNTCPFIDLLGLRLQQLRTGVGVMVALCQTKRNGGKGIDQRIMYPLPYR